jgi:hypothetical protein
VNRFWLMILADFFVLAVIAVVIFLSAAAWHFLTGGAP